MDSELQTPDNRRQIESTGVKEELPDSSTREYIVHIARQHPVSIQLDTSPQHLPTDLLAKWPVERGSELKAHITVDWIMKLIEPLIGKLHPSTNLRLVVNISPEPEVKLPFPDAPSVYAVYDATHGMMRQRLVAANEIPPDPKSETIPLVLTIVCQPVEREGDQWPQNLGIGDSPFDLTDRISNEWAEWSAKHNEKITPETHPHPYHRPHKKHAEEEEAAEAAEVEIRAEEKRREETHHFEEHRREDQRHFDEHRREDLRHEEEKRREERRYEDKHRVEEARETEHRRHEETERTTEHAAFELAALEETTGSVGEIAETSEIPELPEAAGAEYAERAEIPEMPAREAELEAAAEITSETVEAAEAAPEAALEAGGQQEAQERREPEETVEVEQEELTAEPLETQELPEPAEAESPEPAEAQETAEAREPTAGESQQQETTSEPSETQEAPEPQESPEPSETPEPAEPQETAEADEPTVLESQQRQHDPLLEKVKEHARGEMREQMFRAPIDVGERRENEPPPEPERAPEETPRDTAPTREEIPARREAAAAVRRENEREEEILAEGWGNVKSQRVTPPSEEQREFRIPAEPVARKIQVIAEGEIPRSRLRERSLKPSQSIPATKAARAPRRRESREMVAPARLSRLRPFSPVKKIMKALAPAVAREENRAKPPAAKNERKQTVAKKFVAPAVKTKSSPKAARSSLPAAPKNKTPIPPKAASKENRQADRKNIKPRLPHRPSSGTDLEPEPE